MPLTIEREIDLRKRASTDVQDLLAALDETRKELQSVKSAYAILVKELESHAKNR